MTKADGDPFAFGELLSYQEMNRILTDFWQASKPGNLQSGSFWISSVTEKCYLEGISAEEEVLQVTRSWNTQPQFQGLNILTYDQAVLVYEGEVLFYN